MSETNTRQAKRTPVTLKIKFKSETLDQFIERYSVDISGGGIFIRTKDPLGVGTTLRFEFQLKDASPLITGDGTVVWTREHDPTRVGVAPGMGVRFDRLTSKSKDILDKILAEKATKNPGQKGSFEQGGPTRVAPQPIIADLAERSGRTSGSFDDSGDSTPLPKPMPFHSDAEDFPAEAFSEATKVTDLDDLARATGAASAVDASEVPTTVASKGDVDRARAKSKNEAQPKTKAPAPDKTMHGVAPAVQQTSGEADEIAQARAVKEREKREAHARKVKTVVEAAQDPRKQAIKQRLLSKQMALATAGAGSDELAAEIAEEQAAAPVATGGNGGLWIVAGVMMLAVAVGGGYMFMQRGGSDADDQPPVVANGAEPGGDDTSADDKANFPGIGEGPATAVINSDPPGADVELLEHDAIGSVPMTFEGLKEAKTYRAKLVLPGYKTKIVMFTGATSGKPKPELVKLEPMQRRISLKTDPPGATITINEVKIGKVTPADFVLESDLASEDDLNIEIAKKGYVTVLLPVSVTDQFEAKGDEVVLALTEKLNKETKSAPVAGNRAQPERRVVPVRRVRPRRRVNAKPDSKPPDEKPTAKPKDLGTAEPKPEFMP